jgi:hypothetical protein
MASLPVVLVVVMSGGMNAVGPPAANQRPCAADERMDATMQKFESLPMAPQGYPCASMDLGTSNERQVGYVGAVNNV